MYVEVEMKVASARETGAKTAQNRRKNGSVFAVFTD
jgi:hypothetical protein